MKIYQVDVFSNQLFKGNPAAVILLEQWLDEYLMQSIALENNLSETSFARKIDNQNYEIRWFSPVKEVQFCGYGTLATSFIIFKNHPDIQSLTFHVTNLGEFFITRGEKGKIKMNFPVQIPNRLEEIPQVLRDSLSQEIAEVYINPQAYIVVYPNTKSVLNEQPNFDLIKKLGERRVAITSLNDTVDEGLAEFDLVSRYFTPSMGIDEDPVTGSLHTSLIPLWQPLLKKENIVAYQASKRGGVLYCKLLENDRIEVAGECRLYLEGEIFI
ncbi:PhzF family phenazine biosynthesis protein [Acinetobacter suaedae]|uniref:PhzF family phenazine biosynthesis protein n=1 Tax=Acinetobacter suaedae TaxID=2609668 RepID=A0A5P1UQ42_9GAMM|nr:PhzF family phenazine biosynthesis protein [Acinetobacter sp. C16S1]QER38252.1 PhzF family phenazine biosynthesis protein [Acinetobacter sp. C16S1]